MNKRLVVAFVIVAITLGVMVRASVNQSAKAVLTVAELTANPEDRSNIRLGARVAAGSIEYQTAPERLLKFKVQDPGVSDGPVLEVQYHGLMPDTLKIGRDVIVEGSFQAGLFEATNLSTQCPSKYVPPTPTETKNQ